MAVHTVEARVVSRWLDDGGVTLVDVREPAEYNAQSIPGAYSLPLGSVSIHTLPEYADKKLVVHCHSGKRGSAAAEKLVRENPGMDIYNLEGGIGAWRDAGYKVNGKGGLLPLDRQVQLAIGLFVTLGSVLGYYVSPAFFLVSGFIGAGLVFAGLTGYCGLAMLMAKMPWNRKAR